MARRIRCTPRWSGRYSLALGGGCCAVNSPTRWKPAGCAATTTCCDSSTGGSRRARAHQSTSLCEVRGRPPTRPTCGSPNGSPAPGRHRSTHDAGAPCARRCDLSPVPPRRRPRSLGRKHRRQRPRPHRGDHCRGGKRWGLGRLDEAETILLDAGFDDHRSSLSRMAPRFPRDRTRPVLGFPAESVALATDCRRPVVWRTRRDLEPRLTRDGTRLFRPIRRLRCRGGRGTEPELLRAAESRTLSSWAEPDRGPRRGSQAISPKRMPSPTCTASRGSTRASTSVVGGSMGVGWAALIPRRGRNRDRPFRGFRRPSPPATTESASRRSRSSAWAGRTPGSATSTPPPPHSKKPKPRPQPGPVGSMGARRSAGPGWPPPWATSAKLATCSSRPPTKRTARPPSLCALRVAPLRRLDRAKAVEARITRVTKQIDGPLAPAAAAHVHALALTIRRAQECCEQFEQLSMWLSPPSAQPPPREPPRTRRDRRRRSRTRPMRSARRALRRSPADHPRAIADPISADGTGTADRTARGARVHHSRHRRPTQCLLPHHRQPPRPRLHQTRRKSRRELALALVLARHEPDTPSR